MVSRKPSDYLNVLMNGRWVGRLRKLNSGAMSFQYTEDWLTIPKARPISLSLPLRRQDYMGEPVYNFFDNLLPNNERIRARIQARFKVPTRRPFDLLAAIGADCVGAIQLCHENQLTDIKHINAQPLTNTEIAQLLKGYATSPLGMEEDVDDFRISIAGAQEKTALLWHQNQWCRPFGSTATSHIFKLPIGVLEKQSIDLSDSCENEWLCLEIAQAFGFPVAQTQIQAFDDVKVLIVERFDRQWSTDRTWLMRLPQEDMCQAHGVSPGLKYQSDGGPGIVDIMKLLLGAENADADRERFLQSQILFWLLAAIDGHAKNFSIYLRAGGSYRLTPLYDVISAYPLMKTKAISPQTAKMAMAVKGKKNYYQWSMIQPRHFVFTAIAAGFSGNRVETMLDNMLQQVPDVVETVTQKLPADFPQHISEPIFDGMLSLAKRHASTF